MVSVEIKKSENNTPQLFLNGKDISDHIFDFTLRSGRFGEIAELSITMPVSAIEMSKDFWAEIEIKRK